MKFGVVPKEWNDFKQEAVEQLKLAEKLGFHSAWVEEHHESDDYLPSPLIAISALAQHAPRLHFGTAIAILPLYHPVRFASDISILDHATQGKVIIGVGVGYREKDFASFGLSVKERGSRMNENLEVVSKLLEGQKLTYTGKFCAIKDYELKPKSLQNPRPPIWIGGWKRLAIERAARFGDRWFPGPVGTFSYVLDAKKIYIQTLECMKKNIPGISLMRDCYISDTEEHALNDIRAPVMHMYGEDYATSGHPLLQGASSRFDEWVNDRFLIGTPSQVIEKVSWLQKQGFDYMVLRISLRRLQHRKVMDCLRLLGEKVLPYFS